DGPLDVHAVSYFPAVFPGQFSVHNAACAVSFPRFQLVIRHAELRIDLHESLRICAELRKEICRLVVLILSPKPAFVHHLLDSRKSTNLFPIISRQEEPERHLMSRDKTLRRFGTALAHIEGMPNSHHDSEQYQTESDAGNRQHAATLVAKCILRHEASEGHNGDFILRC